MATFPYALGWVPDVPDFRDLDGDADPIKPLLARTRLAAAPAAGVKKAAVPRPAHTDLRAGFSEIEDQGQLGSCTAQAAVGLIEYYERKAGGRHVDASRLFVYKTTRNLLGWKGDTGAYLRSAMKAIVLCGAPPEAHWPYQIARFDEEPPAFVYALGANYKAIKYYRLDRVGEKRQATLDRIRDYLAAGLPSMFGFPVYSSMTDAADIPFPTQQDRHEGGHAIVACGYDDGRKIGPHTGALMIRNSWGTSWGAAGYGWLPYEYVLRGLADDFWSVQKLSWVEDDKFMVP